jgi:hypothetical protein
MDCHKPGKALHGSGQPHGYEFAKIFRACNVNMEELEMGSQQERREQGL